MKEKPNQGMMPKVVKKQIISSLKKFPWRDALLVIFLILMDLSIHPLTAGPDRLVHDPAVYRLLDHNFLPSDWYTAMSVKSGVYTFYAKLIGLGGFFGLPEELWRLLLYLASLSILYYSLVQIGRLFSKNVLVVPVLALLHMMISTGDNQPLWLYGPFAQIDGGFAPRSIGMALSFLALFFLMKIKNSIIVPAVLLGLASLIHVSNSFIVFTLFLFSWLGVTLLNLRPLTKQKWLEIGKKSGIGILVYLVTGGWFAFYVAGRGTMPADFATDKFIWAWVYLRAPYMALPLAGKYWWIRLFAHIAAIMIGWLILRKKITTSAVKRALNIVAIIGLISVFYFFLFYLFAFVWPWLPGFQFYSIRVIYLSYFVAYFFITMSLLIVGRELTTKLSAKINIDKRYTNGIVLIGVAIFLLVFGLKLGESFSKPKIHNLQTSWQRITDNIGNRTKPPQNATFQYLLKNPEPFLAPPDFKTSTYYLPNVASFKSFGFTSEGLPQWFERLNDVSGGQIEQTYSSQLKNGRFSPIYPEWNRLYSNLTAEQVKTLSKKYNFRLFLSYRSLKYPFETITEDDDFRLYKLPR